MAGPFGCRPAWPQSWSRPSPIRAPPVAASRMPLSPLSRSAFALYRLLGAVGEPLAHRYLTRRAARGREEIARLGERFGHSRRPRPSGPLVWVHGASVGEALSALPLISRIRAEWPEIGILMTTGTVTSARLMAERLAPDVIHQYVPIDVPGAVGRFLDHWQPQLGLIIESEFWPTLLSRARARGVELVLVNGRVSAGSYARWARLRPLIAGLLDHFSIVLAQSPDDQEHLERLGARSARCVGNLKFAAPPLAADPPALAALRAAIGARPVWLAASTHPGEEELVAEAHIRLARERADVLTIIAPRHPQRGAAIAETLTTQGLHPALRSRGELPNAETDLYIADTLGELGILYGLCDIVFVGGSLVPKGGQNLLEPAKLGCAILSGPHTSNFAQVSQDMASAGALRRVNDGAELGDAVSDLLAGPDRRAAPTEAAEAYAAMQAGVLDRVVDALRPALQRAADARPS